ncbi:MAG: ABC transporter permease [Gemmatimonadetes bacterium]|nr:ABC transporter permease [Gemmatimonadota bacterium]
MIALISRIGNAVTRWVSLVGALALFFFRIVTCWRTLPRAGRRVVRRVLKDQIWFTALQAVPLIVVLSAILSFLVISQTIQELGRIGATELIGVIIVVAIVRELGPLLTALIVAGRSGTAMAAELATNRVMGELKALEGMGIDPLHYIVLPRFGGAIVSVFVLIVVFDLVAVTSGLVAAVSSGMSVERYFEIVMRSLTFRDSWLTVAKGITFGAVIGVVPLYQGLAAGGASTDVPVASSRAVVGSIVAIFLLSVLFVAVSL